jgi:pimeloyl-ACP methyl ester carboxylesterase
MTTEASFTTSDGQRIAYHIDDFTDPWTTPPVMVLLHSAMGNSQRFYNWVPALARHFRLVRMDLRGHGGSSVPPAEVPLTMDRFVADVRELMDHLGVAEAHIAANSAGGYLAQQLAITSPERVLSLCVVGSTPGLSPSALDWLPQIAKEGLTPFLTRTIAMRFDLESTDPGMVRWFLEQTAANDPAYVVRFIGYMATQNWVDQLPRIKAPTLVILPGGETVGSARLYDAMRDNIPDVTMIEYPHMPHNIADMLPDRCTSDILAFLSRKCGHPQALRK